MNEAFKLILAQALGYSVALFLGLGIVSFFQRGFFFKFFVVKASLGKKILVRIRQVTHTDYKIGKVEEGDLIIGGKKDKKRINNLEQPYIYRSLGINWLDLDGKKWAILPPPDLSAVTGFDAEKQESLVTRALYKPPIEDMKQNILMVLIIASVLAGLLNAYFNYNMLNDIGVIKSELGAIKEMVAKIPIGTVVPTS